MKGEESSFIKIIGNADRYHKDLIGESIEEGLQISKQEAEFRKKAKGITISF